MSVVLFKDIEKEKAFLAACLKGPDFWRSVPENWFAEDITRKCYQEFKKILKPPYSTHPTARIVQEKAEDVDVKMFVAEIDSFEVNAKEINVLTQDLFDMYCSRKVYDFTSGIPADLERMKIEDVIRKGVAEFSNLMNPFTTGNRHREFIYESAIERWEHYKGTEDGSLVQDKIPFGITDLDRYTNGGLGPSHIMCLIGGTGDFKTQTKLNIAYNSAFIAQEPTMLVSLEVPASEEQRDYQRMIDSRHALVEFNDIVAGNLGIYKANYREKLADIHKHQYPLYIVDIPDKATTADLVNEVELYYAKTGHYPKLIVLDYVNEMEPVSAYGNTSEKFKNLGVEIRRFTRSYGCRFVTSMQLNREGKKIKEGEQRDLEHISESHYFSNVCHLVIFLYRDATGIDEVTNQLHWMIRKNRYGQKNVGFTTFANPKFCYVGDRKIEYAGILQ